MRTQFEFELFDDLKKIYFMNDTLGPVFSPQCNDKQIFVNHFTIDN